MKKQKKFKCDCGHIVKTGFFAAEYGQDKNGKTFCYKCCTKLNKARMKNRLIFNICTLKKQCKCRTCKQSVSIKPYKFLLKYKVTEGSQFLLANKLK